MAGSDGVPVECSNAEWHHKAELESFVSILRARNSGEEQGKLQASTRTLNYTFIKPPTGICEAPGSSEYGVIEMQRRHHHLWPSKHPCSSSHLRGNESFQELHPFYPGGLLLLDLTVQASIFKIRMYKKTRLAGRYSVRKNVQ